MFFKIFFLLLAIWVLGLATGYTLKGWIYLLPIVDALLLLIRYGKRVSQQKN